MVRLALHSIAYEAKTLNLSKAGFTAFYVSDTDGLDTHDGGSWAQAFKTIQHALDESESWTTIFIKAGTYAENAEVTKDGISLIGQSRDIVKVSPPSGTALTVTNENFKASSLSTVSNETLTYSTILNGRQGKIDDVALVAGVDLGYGVRVNASNCDLQSVYINDALMKLGVIFGDGINGSEIRDSYLKPTKSSAYGIGFATNASNILIHDNTIEGCLYGISSTAGAEKNTIFHNNFISVSTPIWGAANNYFENYYSDHTTDTNNDGFCDTPYVAPDVTDYKPISKRNGWKQESLGMPIVGGGDATQAKQDIIIVDTEKLYDAAFGVSPIDGSLASFIATGGTVLGTRLPASKSLYDGHLGGIDAVNRSIGNLQMVKTTIDLNQAAATYTLLTGTTQAVVLEKMVFRMPNVDISGGSLTSILIQTDDVTPAVLISSADGAIANLTQEASLTWTGSLLIPVGTLIQLTIAGGVSGTACLCDVVAESRAVVNLGYLS